MPAESIGVRYWKVSPGIDADVWDEFRDNNLISVGYGKNDWRKTKFGNLTKNPNKDLIIKVLKENYRNDKNDSRYSKYADYLIHFFKIKENDKVVAYDKDFHINAMGEVIGEYEFKKDLNYQHIKSVKWLKIFNPPLDIRPIKEKLTTKIWLPPTVIKMDEKDWNILAEKAGMDDKPIHLCVRLNKSGRIDIDKSESHSKKIRDYVLFSYITEKDSKVLSDENIKLLNESISNFHNNFVYLIAENGRYVRKARLLSVEGRGTIEDDKHLPDGWGGEAGLWFKCLDFRDSHLNELKHLLLNSDKAPYLDFNSKFRPFRNTTLVNLVIFDDSYVKQTEKEKPSNPSENSESEVSMNNEEKLVNQIHDSIHTQGFNFELDLIKNYYISLKTKPFVILTGISGTGKTKLAEYFADAVVEDYDKQFRLIPVRPDWTDDKYLVGYYNPITKQYMSTDFIEFLIKAKLDPDNPYFVCLDEMNLARVEYYFSKFLSGLESKDNIIPLHDIGDFTLNSESEKKDEFKAMQNNKEISKEELEGRGLVISHNSTLIPSKIEIPKNLYFTGTVNMDETTFQFSPKVLDRANTIEILGASKPEDFFDRKKGNPDKTGIPEQFKAGIKNKQDYTWPEELKDKIWKIYNILQKDDTHRYDLHFGHRIIDEIGKYMGNSQGLLDQDTAFDLQILQKILPKIRGDESIKSLLSELKKEIELYTLSKQKLTIIEQRLNDRMYTSFF